MFDLSSHSVFAFHSVSLPYEYTPSANTDTLLLMILPEAVSIPFGAFSYFQNAPMPSSQLPNRMSPFAASAVLRPSYAYVVVLRVVSGITYIHKQFCVPGNVICVRKLSAPFT